MEIVLGIVVLIIVYLIYRVKSKSSNMAALPQEFVVFDIETTGLSAQKNEIIEIAAIRINKNSTNHAVFEALVKPTNDLPPKITKLTGITVEMLEEQGKDLEPVIKDFVSFIGNSRLVAFNSKFDMAFLNRAAEQLGISIENDVSCALEMARRAWPGLKSYKLTELAKMAGISTKGTHRALKDAELTVTVYATASSVLGEVQ